jgi:polar amino acid transport system substrate-binding protein
MMKKTVIFFVLTLSFSSSPYVFGADKNHLRINCTIHSPYEAFFRLVKEACSRNDITVERNTPPVGRSLIHVNQGIDDGDGPRIRGLTSTYPKLLCVPEPFGDFHFGAFARPENIRIDGWSSLSNINVPYIHGWKIFDYHVKAARSVTRVKNKGLLFRLLDAGRTDVVLITKLTGYAMIQELGLKDVHFVEPPWPLSPTFCTSTKVIRTWFRNSLKP